MKVVLPLATVLIIALPGCGRADRTEASSTASAAAATQEDDPGEYGPSLGQAHVVRSLTVTLAGAANDTISGKKEDGVTTLSGECRPDLFANLSFDTGGTFDDKGGIGFATNDPITLGQTGPIDLDWVLVDIYKTNSQPEARRYKSDGGTLTLTTHNPAKGSRRMVGTIVAKNLEPLDGLTSPPVDVDAAFDADFSCGVR
jgi:hypothetical protein